MNGKTLKSRIVHKHDIEANWRLATNFTPLQGEMIIYDPDENNTNHRVKIGDGVTNVNDLKFIDDNKVDKIEGKGLSTNDYTTAEKNKLDGIATGANKTIVDSDLSATSTNPVQTKVVNTAISNLTTLVGDKSVASQVNTAVTTAKSYTDTKVAEKADADHEHNYAGSSSIGGAANSVANSMTVQLNGGSTEGTNKFTFNGSEKKSINITPSSIGAAASSHGNHVSYSGVAPVMDGVAFVGSEPTVARSDHTHPTDTTRAAASEVAALKALVGDTSVTTQIENALNNIPQSGGLHIADTAPDNTSLLWIDTSIGGVIKYYYGDAWVAAKSVWG